MSIVRSVDNRMWQEWTADDVAAWESTSIKLISPTSQALERSLPFQHTIIKPGQRIFARRSTGQCYL